MSDKASEKWTLGKIDTILKSIGRKLQRRYPCPRCSKYGKSGCCNDKETWTCVYNDYSHYVWKYECIDCPANLKSKGRKV